ncbi:jg7246 [Pararge aegeria aegeria]|uniref:Lipase n=1 Tax=Pararge aegeria aegeria TaxID=348720 RepID=A0A8S4SAQ2_9NEOP|nr:jg7246 [Pararge aegeria aegeria]
MITTTVFYLTVVEIIVQQISYTSASNAPVILPEDATLTTIGLANKYGHPATRYDVTTEDGYVLGIYRLPGKGRIPVLLMHGLQDSSDSWLLRGQNSLAITLANNGCDVWLGNSRGNRYSRLHKHLNPDTDPAFWQFSFHEMGYYDLPAIIDTILNETGADNLTAIGHSQGTTMFFVLGSEKKEYNSKVNVLVALAPMAFVHNAPAPASILIQLSPLLSQLDREDGSSEVFGDNSTASTLIHTFCTTPITGYLGCVYGIIFPLLGYDPAELDPNFFFVAAAHYPSGGSYLSILHYLQVGYRKAFAPYHYGSDVNMKVYNSSDPPEYQLDQVTMRVALLSARNDRLSSIPDVLHLRRQLPNVVYYLENPRPLMNHVNYVWGLNMQDYLFPYIYSVLQNNHHNLTNMTTQL